MLWICLLLLVSVALVAADDDPVDEYMKENKALDPTNTEFFRPEHQKNIVASIENGDDMFAELIGTEIEKHVIARRSALGLQPHSKGSIHIGGYCTKGALRKALKAVSKHHSIRVASHNTDTHDCVLVHYPKKRVDIDA